MGTELTETLYMDCYDAVRRFVAEHGPVSGIVDLSSVDRFELSPAFLRKIAEMTPAFPVGTTRLVVAMRPDIYGSVRIVHALRSMNPAPIELVRTTDEAFADLRVTRADFAPVGLG